MASITAAAGEKVYSIQRWLGLNEHPDGDTGLKLGEASKMVNWRITRDGNLKRRQGMELVYGLCGDYERKINVSLEPVGVYQTEETLTFYTRASADSDDGRIVVVGSAGSVEHGTWSGSGGTVEDGEMTQDPENPMVVERGVLRVEGASGHEYNMTQLQEALGELEEGAYLFVEAREAIFACNGTCLEHLTDGWHLSGYRVTAEPVTRTPVQGLWSGRAGGRQVLLAACNGTIWNLYDADEAQFTLEFLGEIATDKGVNFIPFDGMVYIQNGYNYFVYDGVNISPVEGYRPRVAISIGPLVNGVAIDGGELTGEYVNLLNGLRRVWISPTAASGSFQLPEGEIKAINRVIKTADGSTIAASNYSFTEAGVVTFTGGLPAAVNSVEIQYEVYRHGDTGHSGIPDYRKQVTDMLYAEIYSGTTDTRLFLYGDGSNKALYTGMDEYGQARADYFPDQYEVAVGDSNTPITAMVRHYSTLIAFKTSECWALEHGIVELANNDLTPAVYVTPVNRDKGNIAMGQVRLVENSPVTCSGTELYHWINGSYYSSNLSRDERQAKRISDRVQASIREIDFENCQMWDDNDNQEFYIAYNGMALVWNYVQDAWYRYENFPAVKMCNFQGEMYIGTPDGAVFRLTDRRMTDNGATVEAEWESGAMDFGAGHMRKYSSMLWVGLKPEEGTSVDVCVETDRKNTFRDKIVSSEKAKIDGQPFMVRTKIKAKKFVYYRLLLSVRERMLPVTVTNVSFRVRQTGYAK